MDALTVDDIESSRAASPAEKLLQALDAAEAGFMLKRASLRSAMPQATEQELDAALERWLLADA